MSFKENINRICLERGTNLTAVVKEVKGSSSFTSAINKGSLPKEEEMVAMAKILHCSVIDFFMDEEDLAPKDTPSERGRRRFAQNLPFAFQTEQTRVHEHGL